jgi:hypothetical protein
MNIDEKICEQQQLVSSKLSIISFYLAVGSYIIVTLALILIFNGSVKTLATVAPVIMNLSLTASFILSIIDLKKKNRKKTLSIIALILSSIYFLVHILFYMR